MILRPISDKIREYFCLDRPTSILLTGGRSASTLYSLMSQDPEIMQALQKVNFYWGDERSVCLENKLSNFNLASKTLFRCGQPSQSNLYPVFGAADDLEEEALRYESVLPKILDLAIFSVGDDGHIASLFPHSKALKCNSRRFVVASSPVFPHVRLTVTPVMLTQVRKILVLAVGEKKQSVYSQASDPKVSFESCPAKLLVEHPWHASIV